MSDPNFNVPLLTDIYIAREFDKPYQIGMVLSHADYSSIKNDEFYTCLEIMTSRANTKVFCHSLPSNAAIDPTSNKSVCQKVVYTSLLLPVGIQTAVPPSCIAMPSMFQLTCWKFNG